MMSKILLSLFTGMLLMLGFNARGQFYNGLQNDFGKNRIQYKQRDWQFYRFDKYDVYFYQNGAELAAFTAESINNNILEFENKIDFTLEDRVEFILYNRQTDFKQSNIGLVTTDPNNGKVTQEIPLEFCIKKLMHHNMNNFETTEDNWQKIDNYNIVEKR